MAKPKYDCSTCIAYCCSIYEIVEVHDSDVSRLAEYFGVTFNEALRKYTKKFEGKRVLKRRKDGIFTRRCMFLDPVTRRCTIYEGRPDTCRNYLSGDNDRCVYYDILQFERKQQGDPAYVPVVEIKILNR